LAHDLARRVLETNRRRYGEYTFVCPSPQLYPFQWAWDSAFHAIVLAHEAPELAQAELDAWLSAQRADGFCGHIVLWDEERRATAPTEWCIALDETSGGFTTVTMQPPVLAVAMERVWQATGDRAWLSGSMPKAVAFYDWLARDRDPLDTGLLTIIQPDESGLDGSPKYDVLTGIDQGPPDQAFAAYERAQRRLHAEYAGHRHEVGFLAQHASFAFRDVLVNSIYGHALRALARLAREASDETLAMRLDTRADRVTAALVEHHWDEQKGAFQDRYGPEGKMVGWLTISSLFPLILADLPRAMVTRLVEEHLINPAEFWLPFPLPSVAASEPCFDPGFTVNAIFRGPTWVNTNWYLYWALRTHGYREAATTLAERTVLMTATSGMREFYDPRTAEGHGATDFAWSSLVLDLVRAEEDRTP